MLIKLENITKTYFNEASKVLREVLKSVNFEVNKGDSLAIIGPSGSGKSTLLNLMGMLDEPTTGKIFFHEKEVGVLKPNELARIRNGNLGFVFQQHHLLPQLSLFENVMVPFLFEKNSETKKAATQRASILLERVGLADKTTQLPGQLSVGECQRTAVVRALINEPEIILADEPTGSLDEESALNLVELLLSIQKEKQVALVMVTHSKELASKLDNCYNLAAGNIHKINL